jgi:nucleotidyltransferase/DNA polymerase involved in DNA repair
MSVLYCTIPHFPAALARRDNPELEGRPLVLIDPEGRVLGASVEAAACSITAGMTVRAAEARCPEARLFEADLALCQSEREVLLQILEGASAQVEPYGWGAAYVDLDDLAQDQPSVVAFCQQVGQTVRQELGEALQPALGWDSNKFTAQAAACRTPPGRFLAIATVREKAFLRPLPVALLPLPGDVIQRLHFLGLRTLGQYASLSGAAVCQQFGPAGKVAHRCARGEDDRPVIPRWQAPQLAARTEFEVPLVERERLMAELGRLTSPLLARLGENLQGCSQIRLTVQFDDGSVQERERTFLLPVAEEARIGRALGDLLDGMRWHAAASALSVALEQIQDAIAEQLTLFPLEDKREEKLQEAQRYLATRFGANRLRQAMMTQPGAPLPEWRIGWLAEAESIRGTGSIRGGEH